MSIKSSKWGIMIGLVAIAFGIWLIFFPTENLKTYPTYLRVMFLVVVFAYGSSRLVRAPLARKRNRWNQRY